MPTSAASVYKCAGTGTRRLPLPPPAVMSHHLSTGWVGGSAGFCVTGHAWLNVLTKLNILGLDPLLLPLPLA